MAKTTVVAHIVTWDSARDIGPCLAALRAQVGFSVGEALRIEITDNASTDRTLDNLYQESDLSIFKNTENLGFCGAHNQAVTRFLAGKSDFLLILNPDVKLELDCLQEVLSAFTEHPDAAMVTPCLYRAGTDLKPLEPRVFDAAGMVLEPTLRHFDRGSGEIDRGQFQKPAWVFGGTGACLVLRRAAVEALVFWNRENCELFDETFFAYREDADLAWRAQIFGLKTFYAPKAIAYHRRRVLPENRDELPTTLNRISVRNRFLMQINNYWPSDYPQAFLPGLIGRNLLVILGVFLREWSSIPGLLQVFRLWPRAWRRRGEIKLQRRSDRPLFGVEEIES